MLILKVDFWINLVSHVLTVATRGYYRPYFAASKLVCKIDIAILTPKGIWEESE